MAPTIVRSLADELVLHRFGPDFYAAFEAGFQDCISRLNNGLPRDLNPHDPECDSGDLTLSATVPFDLYSKANFCPVDA